jgi:hypothetical protein
MQLSGFVTTIAGTVLIAGTVATGSAEASQFTFNFSGRGTSGSVLFDDSIPDTNPDALKGQYLEAIEWFVINIDGTPETGTGIPTFETIQGSSGSVIVGLATDGVGACGPTVNCLSFLLGSNIVPPVQPLNFDLTFYYPADSLSSDALPVTVPVTGSAILRNDFRQFFLGSDAAAVIEPVAVRESTTAWSLLGIGAGLLIVLKHSEIARHAVDS